MREETSDIAAGGVLKTTKGELSNESLVAIIWHNEEGQDTGFLVCERSKLTDEDIEHLTQLHQPKEATTRDAAVKELKKTKVLSIGMMYATAGKRKQAKYAQFKFCHVGSLLSPEYPISMIVSGYDSM